MELKVVVLSLLFLVIGFLVLSPGVLDGGITGAGVISGAAVFGGPPPEGYYWEEAPEIVEGTLIDCLSIVTTTAVGSELQGLNSCCDGENTCGSYYLTGSSSSCFKKNSYHPEKEEEGLVVVDKPILCDLHEGKLKWVACYKEGLLSSDEKFACLNDQWVACDSNQESQFCVGGNGIPYKWNFDIEQTDIFNKIKDYFSQD